MPATTQCTPCCTTPQVTNVPGVAGDPGASGADGINAFTATTTNTTIPAVNSNVSVNVLNSDWMAIGELVFLSDGTDFGTFQVVTITSQTVVSLKFLGYPLDAAPGAIIGSGAVVTPTGQKFTAPTPQSIYGSGAVYEMAIATANLTMGSGATTLTLAGAGKWLLFAQANVKFLSVTWAANHTLELHLRRTNNTAADLTPTMTMTTPIITTITDTFGLFSLPAIPYVPAQAGDIIELWGSISALPDNTAAGTHAVQVTQTALVALQIA